MINKIFSLLLFLFLAINSVSIYALDISCEISENSCNSYLCMEGVNRCGTRGYYLAYAYKYCSKFSKKEHYFSVEGRRWLYDTKVCLQHAALANAEKGLSCRQIKKRGFAHHVPCYVAAGFCELPFKDKFAVMRVIYASLVKPNTLLPGFKVIKKCYMRHRREHYRYLRKLHIKRDFLR